MSFKKATKAKARLRMAIHGPSGSGKTYSALRVAIALVDPGERVALLDTEKGSASKYADKFDFDVLEVEDNYHPDVAGKAIKDAAAAGYGAIVIDSATLFWNGPGGFLELIDQEVLRQKSKNQKADSFAAWKVVDPIYKRFVQAILTAPIHVIVTLRAKTEYERGNDEKGRGYVKKVGMKPEFRENFEYEMDVEALLDTDHNLTIGKTRCDVIDGRVFNKPGADLAGILKTWLFEGAAPALTPEQIRDAAISRFATQMRSASSMEELDKVAAAVAAAHANKDDPVRVALTPIYRQRRTDLRGEPPAAGKLATAPGRASSEEGAGQVGPTAPPDPPPPAAS